MLGAGVLGLMHRVTEEVWAYSVSTWLSRSVQDVQTAVARRIQLRITSCVAMVIVLQAMYSSW